MWRACMIVALSFGIVAVLIAAVSFPRSPLDGPLFYFLLSASLFFVGVGVVAAIEDRGGDGS